MGRHYATVALRTVLELPVLAGTPVIGPLAAGVGCRMAQVQLAPLVIVVCVLPNSGRKDDVIGMEIDRFLRPEPGVVHDREESDEHRSAWLLGTHRSQQLPRLTRVHDASPVDLAGDPRRSPFECPDWVGVEQS